MENESDLFEALEVAREAGKDEVRMHGIRFNTNLDMVRELFAQPQQAVNPTQEQPASTEEHPTSALDSNSTL